MSTALARITQLPAEKQELLASRLAPASFGQQRLWFLDQLHPDNPGYHIFTTVRLKGSLDVEALAAALNEIVRRHHLLRTSFPMIGRRLVQLVHPVAPLQMETFDLCSMDPHEREREVRRMARNEFERPFDLRQGPLLRASLVRMSDQEHVFFLTLHHIVFDGWSRRIFLGELAALYESCSRGAAARLPELGRQYGDFARWQRQWLSGEVLERQLVFWKERLKDAHSSLPLPFDRPRPKAQSSNGARCSIELPAALSDALRVLARESETTPFMLLLAAFKVLLCRYAGIVDISVGTPVAGRDRPELEGLIGFFVNTLVLRTDLSGDPPFSTLLGRVRDTALDAYAHQDLPFEKLVDELQPDRDLGVSPLFQVMFSMQNSAADAAAFPGLELAPLEFEPTAAQFDLTLSLVNTQDAIRGNLEYSSDLFEEVTIQGMIAHYRNLLEGIAADPDMRIRELPMLSQSERRLLLRDWNDTTLSAGRDRDLIEMFETHCEESSGRLALVADQKKVTYGELNRMANLLADRLIELGAGPERVIGIALQRGVDQVVAILATLKSGAAYVPLDVHLPLERLQFMLRDSQAAALVCRGDFAERLGVGLPTIDVEEDSIRSRPDRNPNVDVSRRNLSYIIYTSGSTGRPKGVLIAQEALLNFNLALSQAVYAPLGGLLRVGLNASFAFDASWQQLLQLFNGHTVFLIPDEIRRDGEELVSYLQRQQIDVLDCTPTHLQMMLAGGLESVPSLKAVIAGGETIDRDTWKRLGSHPRIAFFNVYGPTECSINSSGCRIQGGRPVIGRPWANYRLNVLDTAMQLAPPGVSGELFIGGEGLARGYVQRPRETAQRFVPDPFADEGGARLYRSGDFVRHRPSGELEFLGRRDEQVKVRGNRIELGEIESVLRQLPEIREAAAVVRVQAGRPQIVGYVAGPDAFDEAQTREHLKRKLPGYMVPSRFVLLDEIPYSVTGKLDRKALPQPEAERPDLEADFEGARSRKEEELVRIWQEVLGIEQLGIHDNFFELGGDSILTIQAVARANEAGIRITPRLIFQHQTIAELAAASEEVSIVSEQGRIRGQVELTPIQHWFFGLGLRDRNQWNQSLMFRGEGRLQADKLKKLLLRLAEHHDALRNRFRRDEAAWRQETADSESSVLFLSQTVPAGSPDEERSFIESKAARLQQTLDIENGPLAAAAYLELEGGRGWHLVLSIHHLVVDGVSWRIVLEDLMKGYQLLDDDEPLIFGPKTTSFQYWAQKLKERAEGEALRAEAEMWRDALRRPAVRIPLDLDGDNVESSARSVEVELSKEETEVLLREVPKAFNVRIDEVLLAAAASALVEWSGQQGGVLIDLEGHGREELFEEVDLSRTVGWFTSQYPVLLTPPKGPSAGAELLKAVKEQLRRIPDHGIGYGLLRYLSSSQRDSFQGVADAAVSFNYLGQLDRVLREDSLFSVAPESVGWIRGEQEKRSHILEISGSVSGERLAMRWRFSRNLHRESSIAGVAERFKSRLQELLQGSQSSQAEAYTPSDFSKARVNQKDLDKLLSRLKKADAGSARIGG